MTYTVPPNANLIRITEVCGTFVRTQVPSGRSEGQDFVADLIPGAVYRLTSIVPGKTWEVKFLHAAEGGVVEVTEDDVPELLKQSEGE